MLNLELSIHFHNPYVGNDSAHGVLSRVANGHAEAKSMLNSIGAPGFALTEVDNKMFLGKLSMLIEDIDSTLQMSRCTVEGLREFIQNFKNRVNDNDTQSVETCAGFDREKLEKYGHYLRGAMQILDAITSYQASLLQDQMQKEHWDEVVQS